MQVGHLLPTPEYVVRAHLCRGAWHVLVKCQGLPTDDATLGFV